MKHFINVYCRIGANNYFDDYVDYVIALLKTLYLVTTNDWVGHAPDPPF